MIPLSLTDDPALEWAEHSTTTQHPSCRTRIEAKACGCLKHHELCLQHPDPLGQICLCLCHDVNPESGE